MAKKEPKTNAMRMLERAKIPFEVHRYGWNYHRRYVK